MSAMMSAMSAATSVASSASPASSATNGPGWSVAMDLIVAVGVWGATVWVFAAVLLRHERRAGARRRTGQPTVRRTNPRRPIRVSTARDTTIAPTNTTGGMVWIDGVSAARKPSLTYTRGFARTP